MGYMLNIAICDDNVKDIARLNEILITYGCKAPSQYTDGTKLYQAILTGSQYDLVFLDIKMPVIDGFRLAEILQEIRFPGFIVFATISKEYVFQGYEYARGYVTKPYSAKKILAILKRAEMEKRSKFIELPLLTGNEKLAVESIMYFEAARNYVHVHLVGMQVSMRASFSEVEARVNAYGFIKPHRSYLVNPKAIISYSEKAVRVIDNTEIPISRNLRNYFKNDVLKYYGGN